jgi:hypothetical protein
MIIEIKKGDTPDEIEKKLKKLSNKTEDDKKKRLDKLFGSLKLEEDPVTLQRRWRDEW